MKKGTLKGTLMEWETRFRLEAKADGFAGLERFVERLTDRADGDLLGSGVGEKLLEGTVHVVRACCAFWALDGQHEIAGGFLGSQIYPKADSNGTGYSLTFGLHSKALARIVVPEGPRLLSDLDLADLYGFPWDEYRCVGFDRLFIARADWGELTSRELEELEAEVTEDIRYDYSEEELQLLFEPSLEGISLDVFLQDIYEDDV